MAHTLPCGVATRASAIRAALATVTADEVALVFPPGARCALAHPAELAALDAACRSLGKRVIIVGGDELLRAHAVVAGFAAATRLEEWEAPTHPPQTVRRTRALWGPVRRKPAVEEPQPLRLTALPRSPEPAAAYGSAPDEDDLYNQASDDPPRYVADLVTADETLSPLHRQAARPTIPLRSPRVTRRLEEVWREAAESAAMDHAHQEYEERITRAIRATGLVATDQEAAYASEDDGAAEAGSSRHGG